jgi:2-polyprenyl-3-methyl-5-hydroxy-6-metoxy-1,4-benzoquinol methylase
VEKGTPTQAKGPTDTLIVARENEEATEAWSGVLFDRFVEYRDLVVTGLANHGAAAMRMFPPKAGDSILDVGCGFGDASQQLAELVGPNGRVVGVDVSEPFVEASIEEARQARWRTSSSSPATYR